MDENVMFKLSYGLFVLTTKQKEKETPREKIWQRS